MPKRDIHIRIWPKKIAHGLYSEKKIAHGVWLCIVAIVDCDCVRVHLAMQKRDITYALNALHSYVRTFFETERTSVFQAFAFPGGSTSSQLTGGTNSR